MTEEHDPLDLEVEEGAAPRRRKDDTPWWAGLLGVGSVGIGGLQALVGASLLVTGLAGPPEVRGIFALMGCAWLLPGGLVAAGGVGVVLGRDWGRKVSIFAAVAGILGVVAVGLNRSSIPPAIPALVEYAENHPDAPPDTKERIDQAFGGEGRPNLEMMQDERQRDIIGAVFTGYCCVPVMPWYLTLLFALAPAWGRRVVKRDAGEES